MMPTTTVVDWFVDHLKSNLVYIVLIVMGYVVYIKELERRQDMATMINAVREDRELWRNFAMKCYGLDSAKYANLPDDSSKQTFK